jgi:antitoxin component of MazEF toxin-antitoxin module
MEVPMVKTLTQHGNSLALVIDKPILELLNINAKTPLLVVTDGQSLIVSPASSAQEDAAFRRITEKGHKRYGRMFKRLAE